LGKKKETEKNRACVGNHKKKGGHDEKRARKNEPCKKGGKRPGGKKSPLVVQTRQNRKKKMAPRKNAVKGTLEEGETSGGGMRRTPKDWKEGVKKKKKKKAPKTSGKTPRGKICTGRKETRSSAREKKAGIGKKEPKKESKKKVIPGKRGQHCNLRMER